jgi:hypothetical protein
MRFYLYFKDCYWWNSLCVIESIDEAGRLNMEPGGPTSSALWKRSLKPKQV